MPLDADQRDFIRLVATTERRLFAYILSLVPSLSDADDILQETHVRLWEEREKFRPGTDFTAWAIRVAYYEVLTWRKRRSRQKLVFDDELIHELSVVGERVSRTADARYEALRECLSELSGRSRGLIARIYGEGERVKDIATAMGRSADSLYKVVQRLRITLRGCIQQKIAEGLAE